MASRQDKTPENPYQPPTSAHPGRPTIRFSRAVGRALAYGGAVLAVMPIVAATLGFSLDFLFGATLAVVTVGAISVGSILCCLGVMILFANAWQKLRSKSPREELGTAFDDDHGFGEADR